MAVNKSDTGTTETYMPSLPYMTLSTPITKVSNSLDKLLDWSGDGSNAAEKAVDVGDGTLTRVKAYYMPLDDGETDASTSIKFRSPKGKSNNYNEFDRAILGAVSSLVQAGTYVILASTIGRLITGSLDATKFSKGFLAQIQASMEKQCFIYVELDYTEELRRKYPNSDVTEGRLSGWLLPFNRYEVKAGGYLHKGYKLSQCPILFEYANAVDQVLRIPLELLNVGGSNSAERVALKHYLLRRILARKGNMPNVVLFSTLYTVAGITDTSSSNRKRLASVRAYIDKCLKSWTEMGILSEFAYNLAKNHSYYSITFFKGAKCDNLVASQTEQPAEPQPTNTIPLEDLLTERVLLLSEDRLSLDKLTANKLGYTEKS